MNSGANSVRNGACFALLAFAAFAVLAAGCADHGPTDAYSGVLFGQNKGSGPVVQIWNYSEWDVGITTTAGGFKVPPATGPGPDQYVVTIKNTGTSNAFLPITGTLTLQSGSATLANTTAVFGTSGVLVPGASANGYATNGGGTVISPTGNLWYTWQTSFTGATGTADTFGVTLTDAHGESWTGTISGQNN